ncbi:hypothetical protein [Streptomyces rishiriensis]|uniref:Uncharacterized protein n=1 Tax=Streptomyces rishiriensis TaxID=68264 RepID=A0ABU0P387_STRRH|nr:hypothetical protein [Streptomyces rishiriensis]MDQ0585862.1 hypothetical protein [Streptomyces rishiriensis]
MTTDPCPRQHARESRAAGGSVLCAACVSQTARNLRALPGLHQESLHQVAPASRRSNPTRVSGSRRRDHLNIAVLDARYHILATLESWSEIVVEELGAVFPARSVPRLAEFLGRHLEWIVSQPPAADFADEIESLVGEMRSTIDPEPGSLHTLIRTCVMDDCAGTISASLKNSQNTGSRSIECSAGHSWETHEWLRLRQLMERQRKGVDA